MTNTVKEDCHLERLCGEGEKDLIRRCPPNMPMSILNNNILKYTHVQHLG